MAHRTEDATNSEGIVALGSAAFGSWATPGEPVGAADPDARKAKWPQR